MNILYLQYFNLLGFQPLSLLHLPAYTNRFMPFQELMYRKKYLRQTAYINSFFYQYSHHSEITVIANKGQLTGAWRVMV